MCSNLVNYNIGQIKQIKKHLNKGNLKVCNIVPKHDSCNIGSPDCKFENIYTKSLHVDADTIHIGEDFAVHKHCDGCLAIDYIDDDGNQQTKIIGDNDDIKQTINTVLLETKSIAYSQIYYNPSGSEDFYVIDVNDEKEFSFLDNGFVNSFKNIDIKNIENKIISNGVYNINFNCILAIDAASLAAVSLIKNSSKFGNYSGHNMISDNTYTFHCNYIGSLLEDDTITLTCKILNPENDSIKLRVYSWNISIVKIDN